MSSEVIPVALTIAGSNSGGGAGIQADLRTFAFHKVHGTSQTNCEEGKHIGIAPTFSPLFKATVYPQVQNEYRR